MIRIRLSLALLLVFLTTLALAQTDTGSIQGNVTDVQGAAISGATVTATNTATGQTYDATTDTSGAYTIPAVVRGPYKVDIASANFKTQSQNFVLNISERKTFNATLSPGATTETVEVSAAGELVDTTTSSTGEVIQGRQVVELPLNGRNFTQLALLTPGVTRGAYGDNASGVGGNAETYRNGTTGGASLSVNGLRPQANNFTLDGTDNNEGLVNSINFFPPIEATQEFKVNTSVAPAEFGRAGGAIVQTSIKSGTNQIHGSAFDFLRNSVFDASTHYFNPLTNGVETPKSPFKRNVFGGTLGGPIWRNKLFIFGDYQGQRQDEPFDTPVNTVPTALMRMGNFSELLGSGLTNIPNNTVPGCGTVNLPNGAIFDPVHCTVFPGNIIPTSQQNMAAINYLNAFPLPNHGSPGQIENNYINTRTDIRHFNDFDVRLDYNLTSRDTLFGRYSYGQDTFDLSTALVGLPSGFASGVNTNHPRGIAVGETHTFGSSIVNDFRFGYSRPFYSYTNPFNNIPLSQDLGIVNANRTPLLGGGALIGGFNSEISFTGDGGPYVVPQNSYQYEDTISYVHGNHSFRFGANIIQREVDFFQSDFRGKGFFNIGPGTGDFTGYEVSELVSGFIDNYQISTPIDQKTKNWETGYFAQDDWKVTPRLTLNLGLRYDLYTNPYEQKNQWSDFDLNTNTLLEAGVNGVSRSIIQTDKTNFAPRLGFAYDLLGEGKTVVRGGFGRFYFLDRGGINNQLGKNPEWSAASSFPVSQGNRITFSGQAPLNDNNNQDATAALPLPVAGQVDPNNPVGTAVVSIPTNNKTSAINQYNLQISQQFGGNTALNLAYVGTKADHLMTWFDYKNAPRLPGVAAPNLAPNNVQTGFGEGTSKYNGLQVSLNRRMSNGLLYTVAYTWSHTLDDSNGAFSPTNGNGRIFVDPVRGALLNLNYGNSDQDERNAFTFSSLYELPFGRNRKFGSNWNGFTDTVLGGWQINSIIIVGSGTPFDVNSNGGPVNLVGTPVNGINQRASNGNVVWITNAADFQAFNGSGEAVPTLRRNRFAGPGYASVDPSIFKKFRITERIGSEFRAEAFNVFNTPQFQNPDSNINDGNFGQITATRAESERQLQFALRFTF